MSVTSLLTIINLSLGKPICSGRVSPSCMSAMKSPSRLVYCYKGKRVEMCFPKR